jgi:hypothetical protein
LRQIITDLATHAHAHAHSHKHARARARARTGVGDGDALRRDERRRHLPRRLARRPPVRLPSPPRPRAVCTCAGAAAQTITWPGLRWRWASTRCLRGLCTRPARRRTCAITVPKSATRMAGRDLGPSQPRRYAVTQTLSCTKREGQRERERARGRNRDRDRCVGGPRGR